MQEGAVVRWMTFQGDANLCLGHPAGNTHCAGPASGARSVHYSNTGVFNIKDAAGNIIRNYPGMLIDKQYVCTTYRSVF